MWDDINCGFDLKFPDADYLSICLLASSYTIHNNQLKKLKHKDLKLKHKTLNIRPETVNLLDENTGENIQDFGIGNDFTDMTPKAQATKVKMDEWDYTKLNSFYSLHSNEYNGKSKQQPTEWENTFVSHTSDNGLWSCDL